MAHDKFNALFNISSASGTIDPDVFDFVGLVQDNESLYTALDAAVGCIILLDTSGTEPGTVSSYSIETITVQDTVNLAGTMKYRDDPPSIDPGGAVGSPGIIGQASPNAKLPWIAASDTQGYPIKLVEFIHNLENFEREDPNLNTLKTEVFTLNSTDLSNKYIDLSFLPSPPESVVFQVSGGPQQFSPDDWLLVVNGGGALQRISWDTLSLDGILAIGDKVTIQYQMIAE